MPHLHRFDDFTAGGGKEWDASVDVSGEWSTYHRGKVKPQVFAQGLVRCFEGVAEILKSKEKCLPELREILGKVAKADDTEGIIPLLDDLYDWGDRHGIQIKSK